MCAIPAFRCTKATSSVVYLEEKISFSVFSLFLSLLCACSHLHYCGQVYISREQKQLPQDHFSVIKPLKRSSINVKQTKPPTPSSTGMSRICSGERYSSINTSCFFENSSTKGWSRSTIDSAVERIDECSSSCRRHDAHRTTDKIFALNDSDAKTAR